MGIDEWGDVLRLVVAVSGSMASILGLFWGLMRFFRPVAENAANAACERLYERMKGNDFRDLDRRFEQVDRRFEQVDRRFEQVDSRFEKVDERFARVEVRLARMETGLDVAQAERQAIVASIEELKQTILGWRAQTISPGEPAAG